MGKSWKDNKSRSDKWDRIANKYRNKKNRNLKTDRRSSVGPVTEGWTNDEI
jgi:hypothetical protein